MRSAPTIQDTSPGAGVRVPLFLLTPEVAGFAANPDLPSLARQVCTARQPGSCPAGAKHWHLQPDYTPLERGSVVTEKLRSRPSDYGCSQASATNATERLRIPAL